MVRDFTFVLISYAMTFSIIGGKSSTPMDSFLPSTWNRKKKRRRERVYVTYFKE